LIFVEEFVLLVDLLFDLVLGFMSDQRGVFGGFVGDFDVMDIWVMLFLILYIVCGWECDFDLFVCIFLMDFNIYVYEIICIWLFLCVVCVYYENGILLWVWLMIFGFVVDFDCKKMSKFKGNVVVLIEIFDKFGMDVVCWCVVMVCLGMDLFFDEL